MMLPGPLLAACHLAFCKVLFVCFFWTGSHSEAQAGLELLPQARPITMSHLTERETEALTCLSSPTPNPWRLEVNPGNLKQLLQTGRLRASVRFQRPAGMEGQSALRCPGQAC